VVLAATVAATPRPALAQSPRPPAGGVIEGVVTDTNLVELAGASASVFGTTVEVTTGINGRFRIVGLPAGHYLLMVRQLGYGAAAMAVEVVAGDTLRTAILLTKLRSVLDTVKVTGQQLSPRMQEFEERRKLGLGHFITEAELDKERAPYLSSVLRKVLSVDVKSGSGASVAVNHRELSKTCPYRVMVDDVMLPTSPAVNLDDLPAPKDVAGIEVYSGPATIPVQYRGMGMTCGLIIVWTRIGK
jgi:hypothetical protein